MGGQAFFARRKQLSKQKVVSIQKSGIEDE